MRKKRFLHTKLELNRPLFAQAFLVFFLNTYFFKQVPIYIPQGPTRFLTVLSQQIEEKQFCVWKTILNKKKMQIFVMQSIRSTATVKVAGAIRVPN